MKRRSLFKKNVELNNDNMKETNSMTYNWTSRMLCLLALILLSASMMAENYDITVAGTPVTSDNAADVLGDGTVSFSPETNTLTLSGANIDLTDNATNAVRSGISILSIQLIGINTITTHANTPTVFHFLDATRQGYLTLTQETITDEGGNRLGGSLTMKGVSEYSSLFYNYSFTNNFEENQDAEGWHLSQDGTSISVYYVAPAPVIPTTELNISYGQNSRTWASYYTEEKSLQVPDGLEAYVVTSVTAEGVTVEQIDYIPQGSAVLLKRVSDDIEEPITTIPYEGAETTQENLMQGTAEPLAVASMESNVYVLYNDCFTRATSDTIPAGRGYLVLEQEASARLSIVEGVTGLTPVQPSTFNLQPYYDLQGRKVAEPAGRQLLIKNSKKYIFR